MEGITTTLPPDVIRTIFSYSNKGQYVLRTSKQTTINPKELNRKECRRTPTRLEFLKYLVYFLSTYTAKSPIVSIFYISGYGLVNFDDKPELVNTYKDSRRMPIIIAIIVKNKKQSIDVLIEKAGIGKGEFRDHLYFQRRVIDHYEMPRKDREEYIQQILVNLPFDVEEVIPDTSSLQELLDLRLSCNFTNKEVDQLVLDIYDREKVVKNTLSKSRNINIEDKIQLIILLRNLNTTEYFLEKVREYEEEHPELDEKERRSLLKLRTYTYKPVENLDTEDL